MSGKQSNMQLVVGLNLDMGKQKYDIRLSQYQQKQVWNKYDALKTAHELDLDTY